MIASLRDIFLRGKDQSLKMYSFLLICDTSSSLELYTNRPGDLLYCYVFFIVESPDTNPPDCGRLTKN